MQQIYMRFRILCKPFYAFEFFENFTTLKVVGLTLVCNFTLLTSVELDKSDGSKVSNLETSPWQRRWIARSDLGVKYKFRWSNAID